MYVMYVCHVCMYVCHVCMYVCMYACMYTCTGLKYSEVKASGSVKVAKISKEAYINVLGKLSF